MADISGVNRFGQTLESLVSRYEVPEIEPMSETMRVDEIVETLGKSLDAMEQSGKVSEEALKVGRQSRNIAIAALVVAALSLLVMGLSLALQLLSAC